MRAAKPQQQALDNGQPRKDGIHHGINACAGIQQRINHKEITGACQCCQQRCTRAHCTTLLRSQGGQWGGTTGNIIRTVKRVFRDYRRDPGAILVGGVHRDSTTQGAPEQDNLGQVRARRGEVGDGQGATAEVGVELGKWGVDEGPAGTIQSPRPAPQPSWACEHASVSRCILGALGSLRVSGRCHVWAHLLGRDGGVLAREHVLHDLPHTRSIAPSDRELRASSKSNGSPNWFQHTATATSTSTSTHTYTHTTHAPQLVNNTATASTPLRWLDMKWGLLKHRPAQQRACLPSRTTACWHRYRSPHRVGIPHQALLAGMPLTVTIPPVVHQQHLATQAARNMGPHDSDAPCAARRRTTCLPTLHCRAL